jgi:UDP-glucose 4-epimerase
MIKQALETNSITYKGTGNESREYIHASDGAAAAVEMLKPEFKNQIIHLTGNERITTQDMMHMIAEILGSDVSIKVNAGEMVGHYFQTPYSYTPKFGRKHIQSSYIDIGSGLLDLIERHDQELSK